MEDGLIRLEHAGKAVARRTQHKHYNKMHNGTYPDDLPDGIIGGQIFYSGVKQRK